MKRLQKAFVLGFVLFGVGTSFGADFTKLKDAELIEQAGKVAPNDVPDFKMEIHKRIQEMKVKDSIKFKEALRNKSIENLDKLTNKQRKERCEAVQIAMEKKMESMTREQIIESGLARKMYKNKKRDGKHHRQCDYDRGMDRDHKGWDY